MAIETDALAPPEAPPSYKGPLAYAISCFSVWGLAYGLLDVLNSHFQDTLHVSKAQSTLLQTAYFGAYLLMSLPAGVLMQAKGFKFGLVTGLVVTALGAFLFTPSARAASFPMFVGATFVMATGLCFLETSADTYVNVLGSPARASLRLNLAQSFNALGVTVGPLIGGALFFGHGTGAAAETTVQLTYAAIGVVVLIFAFVLSRARLPEVRDASHGGAGDGARVSLWRERHFQLGVLTQALYIGAQVGIGALFINLLKDTWLGGDTKRASYLFGLAMFGFLAGRFLATALMVKVPPRVILTIYGVINVALCVVTALGAGKISAWALMAVPFFEGTMFATIFTLSVAGLGASTKRASSIMVMAIGGGVLAPYPMGLVADRWGTPAAFYLPAACFALVALYGRLKPPAR
jgi:FHS family L-fucose permease-like MFS transporter